MLNSIIEYILSIPWFVWAFGGFLGFLAILMKRNQKARPKKKPSWFVRFINNLIRFGMIWLGWEIINGLLRSYWFNWFPEVEYIWAQLGGFAFAAFALLQIVTRLRKFTHGQLEEDQVRHQPVVATPAPAKGIAGTEGDDASGTGAAGGKSAADVQGRSSGQMPKKKSRWKK